GNRAVAGVVSARHDQQMARDKRRVVGEQVERWRLSQRQLQIATLAERATWLWRWRHQIVHPHPAFPARMSRFTLPAGDGAQRSTVSGRLRWPCLRAQAARQRWAPLRLRWLPGWRATLWALERRPALRRRCCAASHSASRPG